MAADALILLGVERFKNFKVQTVLVNSQSNMDCPSKQSCPTECQEAMTLVTFHKIAKQIHKRKRPKIAPLNSLSSSPSSPSSTLCGPPVNVVMGVVGPGGGDVG